MFQIGQIGQYVRKFYRRKDWWIIWWNACWVFVFDVVLFFKLFLKTKSGKKSFLIVNLKVAEATHVDPGVNTWEVLLKLGIFWYEQLNIFLMIEKRSQKFQINLHH